MGNVERGIFLSVVLVELSGIYGDSGKLPATDNRKFIDIRYYRPHPHPDTPETF